MTVNVPYLALSLSTPAQILVDIGRRARAERIRRNLTQGDLAAAAGVARRTIARLEAGEPVGSDVLVRVALSLRSERGLSELFNSSETRSVGEVLASAVQSSPQRVRARRAPR